MNQTFKNSHRLAELEAEPRARREVGGSLEAHEGANVATCVAVTNLHNNLVADVEGHANADGRRPQKLRVWSFGPFEGRKYTVSLHKL